MHAGRERCALGAYYSSYLPSGDSRGGGRLVNVGRGTTIVSGVWDESVGSRCDLLYHLHGVLSKLDKLNQEEATG